MRTFLPVSVLLSVSLLAGCSDKGSGSGGPDSGSAGAPGATGPTFYDDVGPIMNAKCVRCHQQGGIGPFRLDNYADAKTNAAAALAMIKAGKMPPYYINHDGTCGDFIADEALTNTEKATIEAWVTKGTLEGPKKTIVAPQVPKLADGRDLKTPMFSPVAGGGAVDLFDEYRCFPIATGVDKDTFVTGYDVLPGNDRVVHHVLGFVIDGERMTADGKKNSDVLKALDDMSPDRAGWPCFGGAADQAGVSSDAVPVDWGPGQGIVSYPDKMGVRLRKSDIFVVQVHYNLADPMTKGMSDSTTVRLRLADTVDRRLVFLLPDGFLDTLRSGKPEALPPGEMSTKFTFTKDAKALGISALPFVDLVAVLPHMHERGRGLEVRLMDGTSNSCVAKLDLWDFHWQKMYFYKKPPRLTPTSSIQVTCDWDTSGDTRPVLPGWGTRNEMCLSVLMVALPPGV
jgi:hypothetical protein